MAQHTIIEYVDDLDGTPLSDTNHRIVRLTARSTNYRLDLSLDNAEKLEAALAPYIAAASIDHTVTTRPAPKQPRRNSPARRDTRHIRQWAKDNGYNISDRGMLPQKVIDAYNARAK